MLENGLTLVHRADFSSEVVSVQVWVKTGSIHEGALLGSGLSHYLEHLLFKGTARRSGKSISRGGSRAGSVRQRLHDLRPHGLLHRCPGRRLRAGWSISWPTSFSESQLPEAEVLRDAGR